MTRYLIGFSSLLTTIAVVSFALSPTAYDALIILIWVTFSLLMFSFYLIHKKHIHNSLLSGLMIFLFIFLSIMAIYMNQGLGFSAINDMVTSALLILGFMLALVIYLINRNIISSHNAINFIEKTPNYIPFSHALKKYLLSLIKVEYKIIVLIRTLDEKNSEWILTQISAYNHILKNNTSVLDIKEKGDIEFVFVDNNSDDINHLIQNLNTIQYRYIIITSLSEIFRESIISRENLTQQRRESIQIIGALSSINDKKIEKIIDRDDDIIRIFPPDYDEAKTAIEFMFSKVKSAICVDENCTHYHQKNNIIIIAQWDVW